MVRKMAKHRTVNVRVGDVQADIDEEIAPLIRELWKAGIDTLNSCQENRPGIVWVQFATADDAATFLNIVAQYEEEADGLYNRITGRWETSEHADPQWEYAVFPEDLGLVEAFTEDDKVEEWHEGQAEFVFSLSVRFPRSDFPAVLARVVRFNEERENLARALDAARAGDENAGREAGLTPALPDAVADATGSVLVQAAG